jgi:hypothetical protein
MPAPLPRDIERLGGWSSVIEVLKIECYWTLKLTIISWTSPLILASAVMISLPWLFISAPPQSHVVASSNLIRQLSSPPCDYQIKVDNLCFRRMRDGRGGSMPSYQNICFRNIEGPCSLTYLISHLLVPVKASWEASDRIPCIHSSGTKLN